MLKLVFLTLFGFSSYAQQVIGIVDTEFIMANSLYGKKVFEELKHEDSENKRVIEERSNLFKSRVEAFEKNAKVLKKEQIERDHAKLSDEEANLDKLGQELSARMQTKQANFIDELTAQISSATKVIADNKKLFMVVDKKMPIIYMQKTEDLTSEVLADLDKKFKEVSLEKNKSN